MTPVKMYTTAVCPYCIRAKQILKSRGVSHIEEVRIDLSDQEEITVTATVTAKINEQTMFLVEAKQAGIFEIRYMPEGQLQPITGIACPQIIYPYLRSNVADVIQRAGFPPVHMAEINFQAMYDQQQRMKAEQQLQ
ncbi:MAG: hypothetical protein EB110_09405 [Betaproteobacteria bacterium]|nr:hypothetical protein [Betaproteobacteria bacterium]